MRANRSGWSCV